MTVRIGFSSDGSLVSKAIRLFSKARVSHAFLLFDDPALGGPMVMEANWDGYHIKAPSPDISAALSFHLEKQPARFSGFVRTVSQWVNSKTGSRIVLVTPMVSIDNVLPTCARWLGTPYDYPGLLGIGLVMVGRFFKQKWKTPMQSGKAMFCSEAIVRALQKEGFPGSEKLVPAEVSPQDLLDFLDQ